MSCGSVDAGQTGCGVNDRLRERSDYLRASHPGHLAGHAKDCWCESDFSIVHILEILDDRRAIEIHKVSTIKSTGKPKSVSDASVSLFEVHTLPVRSLKEEKKAPSVFVSRTCGVFSCHLSSSRLPRFLLCFIAPLNLSFCFWFVSPPPFHPGFTCCFSYTVACFNKISC